MVLVVSSNAGKEIGSSRGLQVVLGFIHLL